MPDEIDATSSGAGPTGPSATRPGAPSLFAALGVLWGFTLLHRIAFMVWNWLIFSGGVRYGTSVTAMSEQVALLTRISRALGLVELLTVAIAIGLLARALPGKRRLAVIALVVLGVDVLILASHFAWSRDLGRLWMVQLVTRHAVIVLTLVLGLPRAVSGRQAGRGLLVAFIAVAATYDVAAIGHFLTQWRIPSFHWVLFGLSVAGGALATIAAFRLSDLLRRQGSAVAPVVHGKPLRLLANGLIARLVLGLLGQVAVVAMLASGQQGSAGGVLVVTALFSACASVAIGAGLLGYLKLPEELRSSAAVFFALGALGLGVGLDLFGAVLGHRLFGMLGELSRPRSSWGMPSLRAIESLQSLQTTMRILGALAVALGIASGLALTSSLRQTARGVKSVALEALAGRVTGLLVVAGIAAVLVGLATGRVRETGLLLVAALVVLGLGIALLASWLRLLYGLGHALDEEG